MGLVPIGDRVVPLLEQAGHAAIAVDLPGPDDRAGLADLQAFAVTAAEGHDEVVIVAQSLGGFTAPIAAERLPVSSIVLVNAMVPLPARRPGEWSGNTGAIEARGRRPRQPVGTARSSWRPTSCTTSTRSVCVTSEYPESDRVFGAPCSFSRWPDVPIRVLAGADDRFLPLALQQRVARDRLGH